MTDAKIWKSYGEHYAACNIVHHDWFGFGSVLVVGGISMEGHTDLSRLNKGTLIAISYQN